MAVTGTEYLRTVPERHGTWPVVPVVVGDKIVTFGKQSAFTILDIPSLVATSYAPSLNQAVCGAVTDGTYAYFQPGNVTDSFPRTTWGPPSGTYWSSGYARKLDLTTGATSPLPQSWASPMATVGTDYIVGYTTYRISTNTFTTYSPIANNNAIGVAGSRLYAGTGTTLYEINVATPAVVDTITLAAPLTPFSIATRIGDVLWWPSTGAGIACVGVDTSTNTPVIRAAKSITFAAPTHNWVSGTSYKAGSDGYLYRLRDTNTMQIVDPVTGDFANETLPVSRTEREILVMHAGQPWIPSPQPR